MREELGEKRKKRTNRIYRTRAPDNKGGQGGLNRPAVLLPALSEDRRRSNMKDMEVGTREQ